VAKIRHFAIEKKSPKEHGQRKSPYLEEKIWNHQDFGRIW
jgi:hypothetical protein